MGERPNPLWSTNGPKVGAEFPYLAVNYAIVFSYNARFWFRFWSTNGPMVGVEVPYLLANYANVFSYNARLWLRIHSG